MMLWKCCTQCSSVARSCLTLCNLMDCSTPGFPVTNSWSLLKFMSIESVMPSNHLILCRPLLLLPSIFPSIKVFSSESVHHFRWLSKVLEFQLQHQSFQWMFKTDSFRMDWFDLLAVQGALKSLAPMPQFKSINSLEFSFFYSLTFTSIHDS